MSRLATPKPNPGCCSGNGLLPRAARRGWCFMPKDGLTFGMGGVMLAQSLPSRREDEGGAAVLGRGGQTWQVFELEGACVDRHPMPTRSAKLPHGDELVHRRRK